MNWQQVINGERRWSVDCSDCLEWLRTIPDESVNCCVTSPPYYGLRNYGHDGQIGLEKTHIEYVAKMVEVFGEIRRVLTEDGLLWLNIGDSYASGKGTCHNPGGNTSSFNVHLKSENVHPLDRGNKSTLAKVGLKPKDLIGIPWSVAFALRADGWYLRAAIIWAKPNGMPGSQEDRPTSSYETIFLLSKSRRYYSDFDAIKTPPRESSLIRTAQDIQAQAGSHRANGGAKTNGAMKAVGVCASSTLQGSYVGRHSDNVMPEKERRRSDKQRGHSRKHDGFNDRWDAMSREEQMSKPAMIRDVWFVPPAQTGINHFAVMPYEVARRCILAGCPAGGIVIDPFCGSGTTLEVAVDLGCRGIGCELNPEYVNLIENRMSGVTASLFVA